MFDQCKEIESVTKAQLNLEKFVREKHAVDEAAWFGILGKF